jgi:hypothetical protein
MPRPLEADIETGHRSNSCLAPSIINCCVGGGCLSILSSWRKKLFKGAYNRDGHQRRPVQSTICLRFRKRGKTYCLHASVEDYPSRYPRFSALIASHDSFHICRRFSNLRTRLLLLKQDRLSLLEKQLQKIDREEVSLLSLGSSRRDSNSERNSVLSQVDEALADYGMKTLPLGARRSNERHR